MITTKRKKKTVNSPPGGTDPSDMQSGWYWRSVAGQQEILKILANSEAETILENEELGWQREED